MPIITNVTEKNEYQRMLNDTLPYSKCFDTGSGSPRIPKRNPYVKKAPNYSGFVVGLCIKKVIFHGPATIVIWDDNTKTVVKCMEGDVFDPEKGLAMAISKRIFGDDFHSTFKRYLKEARK